MADKENNTTKENIDRFTVKELKDFLRNHQQPVGGRSRELKERAKGVIDLDLPSRNALATVDQNANSQRQERKFVTPLGELLPHPSSLKDWTNDVSLTPEFTYNELYNYLVLNNRRTFDNEAKNASKQLKAKVFYDNNHVHSLLYHGVNDEMSHGYISCKVIPSMPTADAMKHPDYKVWISLSKISGQVHAADCTCPAGNGESCNHIAALLYALVDISEKRKSGELASTATNCKWNVPRPRKLSPKKAENIQFKKNSELPVSGYVAFRPAGNQASLDKEDFRTKLMTINPNAGYLRLFKKPEISTDILNQTCLPSPDFNYSDSVNLNSEECQLQFKLYVESLECEAAIIEQLTKGQTKNDAWKKARIGRITASRFGTVIKRNTNINPVSIIKSVLGYYPYRTTDAQEWGLNHELRAKREYIHSMEKIGHKSISVEDCGLCVLASYPYIGASPDGFVYCSCSHCGYSEGLVEVKCPFKYSDLSPESAALKHDFCSKIDSENKIKLKTNHNYYYQVQGQMGENGVTLLFGQLKESLLRGSILTLNCGKMILFQNSLNFLSIILFQKCTPVESSEKCKNFHIFPLSDIYIVKVTEVCSYLLFPVVMYVHEFPVELHVVL